MGIPAIVWHELWFGCFRLAQSARRDAIESYLNDVVALTIPILPYDERAAEWHARERGRLVTIGRTPTFADGQVAAVAAVNELVLVTLNDRDFRDFAKLSTTTWAS